MQVNNNYQFGFRAAQFTPRALRALSERVPSGQFDIVKDRFLKMYEKSPLAIVVDTVTEDAVRLSARIEEIKPANKYSAERDYVEESIFSSTFCNPKKFLKKLCENIDKKEIKISGNLSRTDKGV